MQLLRVGCQVASQAGSGSAARAQFAGGRPHRRRGKGRKSRDRLHAPVLANHLSALLRKTAKIGPERGHAGQRPIHRHIMAWE